MSTYLSSDSFPILIKTIYSVNNFYDFVEKCIVKVYLFLTFLFGFIASGFFVKLRACELSPYFKLELLQKKRTSFEHLGHKQNIACPKSDSSEFNLFMSDLRKIKTKEQERRFVFEVLKDSNLFFDDLTIQGNGVYLWSISNQRYFYEKGKRKTARTIASTTIEKSNVSNIKDTKASKNLKKPTQALFFSLASSTSSIASTDTTSGVTEKALSDLGFGAVMVWSHLWTKSLSYFVVGSIKQQGFRTSGTRSLTNSKVNFGYVGTGLNIKVTDRFSLTPGLGIGESLILSSSSGSDLEIKKASIPAFSLSSKIDLVRFDSGFTLNLNGRFGALIASKQDGYETEFGHYSQVGIGSSFDLFGVRLNINSSYTQRSLSVGTAEQTSKEMGISAGFGWSF